MLYIKSMKQDGTYQILEADGYVEFLKKDIGGDQAIQQAVEDRGGKPPSEIICEHCEKEFISAFHQARFCSQKCATLSVRKFEISKDELEELVWSMSTVKVARLLGVSDVAIAKRCKLLGVEKPPRGYWAKFQYDKL